MYHPTTRVLAVLELLQTHARLSAGEMARRLAVDARTVRRYIVMLEEIGIPITSERGRHGGYALMAGFKLPPMMFTDDEALALSIGLLAARSLGLSEAAPAVASALAKLERIMPDKLKQRIRAIDATVRLDMATPTVPTDNAALIALSAAAQAQLRVTMHYRTEHGVASERAFDAYGLVFKGACWYVVGMCHLRQALRSFRLDRIVSVAPSQCAFERPHGFDVLLSLKRSMASMPAAFAVEVLLKTDLRTARAYLHGAGELFEQTGDGVLLCTQTDHLDWFAGRLAGLPCGFVVRNPPELRSALSQQAQRLMRLAQLVG